MLAGKKNQGKSWKVFEEEIKRGKRGERTKGKRNPGKEEEKEPVSHVCFSIQERHPRLSNDQGKL